MNKLLNKINNVVEEDNTKYGTPINIPTVCPICGQPLTIVQKYNTEVLTCVNSNCGAKIEGKLLHFVGTSGLDIESMSIATVRDLIKFGWFTKLSDIFSLKNHRTEWVNSKGYGSESVDKILNAIPTSLELWKIIASAGIPGVEKKTSMLLADTFETWIDFRDAVDTKYDFSNIKGIGPTTALVISTFDYSEIDEVMKYITVKQKIVGGKLDNMSFCITGSLSMKRDDMVKIIEANGGKIAGVNKKLTYLICNDTTSTSGKSKKAKELGIKVITEEEFNTLLNA